MKLNPRRDELAKQSFAQAGSIARKMIALGNGSEIVDRFAQELEASSGKKILLEVDRDIPTAAKLEVAENYDRDEHVVRFKPDYPNVEHLQAHELFHLKFIVEARAADANMLFVSRKKHREAFIRSLEKHVTKLNQMGYGDETLATYLTALYEGITRQVHNAPIDLFIEQGIYEDFPELRPYQFQSLGALLGEALHATTEPSIVELTPPSVLSKSKTFNLLLAYQFKELYGVDMIAAFKASAAEKTLADRFYAEFVEYRSDREGGEEYEVVDHWGHDLQLEAYYELIPEATPDRVSGSLQDQVASIEDDPLNQRSKDPVRDEEMRTFQEGQKAIGTNMAVVMYMVDALQVFSAMEPSKIKEVALEIAMLGAQGISPDKKGYKLHHVPEKTFTGYHLLAFYYVSWKLAIPEMLAQLRLPYDNEWAMAEQMHAGGE